MGVEVSVGVKISTAQWACFCIHVGHVCHSDYSFWPWEAIHGHLVSCTTCSLDVTGMDHKSFNEEPISFFLHGWLGKVENMPSRSGPGIWQWELEKLPLSRGEAPGPSRLCCRAPSWLWVSVPFTLPSLWWLFLILLVLERKRSWGKEGKHEDSEELLPCPICCFEFSVPGCYLTSLLFIAGAFQCYNNTLRLNFFLFTLVSIFMWVPVP